MTEAEQRSGPVDVRGPDGKRMRMFLTHHAPQAAKRWWQPAVMALLAAATTWLTVRPQAPAEGRDARDKDVIALQESMRALWGSSAALREANAALRERVGYLEGCFSIRNATRAPEVPVVGPPDAVRVDQRALDAYQSARK